MRTRRNDKILPPPAPPTVTDLEAAPELAAIILLEHALDVVREALLAEHRTLIDDFRRPEDDGPILSLASAICLRAPALRDILRRYRSAVRLAAATPADHADDDLPF